MEVTVSEITHCAGVPCALAVPSDPPVRTMLLVPALAVMDEKEQPSETFGVAAITRLLGSAMVAAMPLRAFWLSAL